MLFASLFDNFMTGVFILGVLAVWSAKAATNSSVQRGMASWFFSKK